MASDVLIHFMNLITTPKNSRRDWLRQGAAATLALGLWPGCARLADLGQGENFSFVVMNDAHYSSPKCPEFFARVAASIRAQSPRPEFCLMVGDLAEHGTRQELGGMREVLRGLGMPFHCVIGNHDYLTQTDRSVWDEMFPGSLNHYFQHRGWQVVGLDSSDGLKYQGTRVQAATLGWVDEQRPKWDQRRPMILFTHFPLGPDTTYRPANADDLIERFRDFNLVAVFNGHFHGFTQRMVRDTVFTTNKCCSTARGNHDKTTEKGYFLCQTRAGRIERKFIEIAPA